MNTAEKRLSYDELYSEYLQLKQELADLKRLIFGQKRERFIPGKSDIQLSFGLGLEPLARLEDTSEQITYQRKKNKAKYTPHLPPGLACSFAAQRNDHSSRKKRPKA